MVIAIVVVCVSIQFRAQCQDKTTAPDQCSHWSNYASSGGICSAQCHLNFEEKVEENACLWRERMISEWVLFHMTVALPKKTDLTVVFRMLIAVNVLCSGVFVRGMFWLLQGSPVGEKSCCLVRDDS